MFGISLSMICKETYKNENILIIIEFNANIIHLPDQYQYQLM